MTALYILAGIFVLSIGGAAWALHVSFPSDDANWLDTWEGQSAAGIEPFESRETIEDRARR